MHRHLFACALGASLLFLGTRRIEAQGPNVEELRRQIQALEQQLASIEANRAGAGRVTQIGATRLPGRTGGLVVRLYDLSDLFANAPTYEARHTSDLKPGSQPLFERSVPVSGSGGVGGFGGAGFFAVPSSVGRSQEKSHPLGQVLSNDGGRASMDALISAIQSTISTDDWDTVGGPSSIAQLGNALLISADENTHDQIEALFKLFRQRWGTLRTVSVQAWWLWLKDAELAQLLAGDVRPADQPFGKVNAANFAKLLDQFDEAEAADKRGYRAALTCYNGQTVYTLSGGQSLAVTGIQPVALPDDDDDGHGRELYSAQVSVIQEGAALQVTPLVSTGGKVVVLDVHSRVCQLRDNGAAQQAGGKPAVKKRDNPFGDDVGAAAVERVNGAAVVGMLDRPSLVQHRLSTTLRVPAGETMLIGGMTFDSSAGGRPNLYLFARTSVQELRDDEEGSQKVEVKPEKPEGEPKPE